MPVLLYYTIANKMRKFIIIPVSVAFLAVASVLPSLVVADSAENIHELQMESGCSGSNCTSPTIKPTENSSSNTLAIALASVVICSLPPITWGLVIWWGCRSDPMKRRRRQLRRLRSQAAVQRRAEENNVLRSNDRPPPYDAARHFPLYQPASAAVSVLHEGGAGGETGTAAAGGSPPSSSQEGLPPSYEEGPPPSYEEGPPPSYAFVISGNLIV